VSAADWEIILIASSPAPLLLQEKGPGVEVFWLIPRSLLRNLGPGLALGFIPIDCFSVPDLVS